MGRRGHTSGLRAPTALLTLVTLATAAVLAGCGGSGEDAGPTERADTLWAARTAYTGDNSRVSALVAAAGFGPAGDYTVALRTATPPYAATVAFQTLDKPFADVDFQRSATLVLGLVGNLDQVDVTYQGSRYALTATEASRRLGYDVKSLGADRQRLETYLASAAD